MRNTFAHAPLAEAPAIQHHHQKGPEKFLNIEDVQSLSFWAIFFMVLDVHPGACLGSPFEGWDLKWWSGALLDSKTS